MNYIFHSIDAITIIFTGHMEAIFIEVQARPKYNLIYLNKEMQ